MAKNANDISHNTCPVSIVSFSISFWPCLISSGSVFLTEPFLSLTLQNSNKQNILTRGNKVHQLYAQRSCFFVSSTSLTCHCAGCGGYCGLSSVSQRLCPPADNPAERRLSQGWARHRQFPLHRNSTACQKLKSYTECAVLAKANQFCCVKKMSYFACRAWIYNAEV